MKLDIYYSGIRVAGWSPQTGFVCREDLPYMKALLERMLPGDLGQLLEEAQTCPGSGETEFLLCGGRRYIRREDGMLLQYGVKYPVDIMTDGERAVGFFQPELTAVIMGIAVDAERPAVLRAWDELYGGMPSFRLSPPSPLNLTMRDGCTLAADLYLPAGAELPLPCVLVRTPYGKENAVEDIAPFVMRGYACVVQDVRGRHASGGDWAPFMHEIDDGADTLAALSQCQWCSGSIGMFGSSYQGYTQWAAAAACDPHLKALVSLVTAGTAFVDAPFPGGAVSSADAAWFALTAEPCTDPGAVVRDDWDEILRHRPVDTLLEEKLGLDLPFWKERLQHPCEDAYWAGNNWFRRGRENGGTLVNAFIQTGWFDDDGAGSLQAVRLTDERSGGSRKLMFGPWCHAGNSNHELNGTDMGRQALRYDLDLEYFRWFEKHLRGRGDVEVSEGTEYFAFGADRWKTCKLWPPENTSPCTLYLAEGTLSEDLPKDGSASYVYDPLHPARQLVNPLENEFQIPADYAEEEKRSDFLLFTGSPMEADTTFSGNARFTLWFSSDSPSTDLVVRLSRVDPRGRSIKTGMSVLNLCLREGSDKHVFMEPGQVYRVSMETAFFSVTVRKGERLRVSVTSSAEGLVFPNPNTRRGLLGREVRKACNTVHFGPLTPSCVTLDKEE